MPRGTAGPKRRTGLRRLLPTWRMLLGGMLGLLLAATGVLIAGYLLVDIPAAKTAALAQNNLYLYSDGTPMARDGEVNRERVSLSEIPRHTQHAVLAAEDRNFYSESAIDVTAMVRAGWNMLQGGGKQSGSTITQQYVKNYYLNQEQTVTRKAKEFFIAVKLDREVSKDEILGGYLNTSYFGRNSYGIQAAAHAYYGKQAKDLTVAEGAYLAALVNAPGVYDTRTHPGNRSRAVGRWNYVLDGMVEQGWLDKSERSRLRFPEPSVYKPPNSLSGQRGYLIEAVKTYLDASGVVSRERLEGGGFRITTTIDRRKQEALLGAVSEQLTSKLDRERSADAGVRAGATSIDPRTGKVVAMYGGADYVKQYTNGATRRDYQVGSTFKPIVLASAIENGARTQQGQKITPDTTYDGSSGREVVGPMGPVNFAPENEDHRSYGQIRVTEAMDKSVNSVFAQMGMDVGPENVRSTAIKLGIPKDTPGLQDSHGAISLGTSTASTLDMAETYATLADHGRHTPHRLVEKITRGEETIQVPESGTEEAVSRQAADSTTRVLLGVVRGGTGQAAKLPERPVAGKTGTAEEDKAAWFAGYTPDLVTVVAVLGQNPKSGAQQPLYGALGEARINGGGPPAKIWAAYTAHALRGSPAADFDLEAKRGAPDEGDESAEPSQSGSPGSSESGSPSSTDRPDTSEPSSPQRPSELPERPDSPTGPPGRTTGPGSPTRPPGSDGEVGFDRGPGGVGLDHDTAIGYLHRGWRALAP